tara:strand:- start:1800 stop:2186 length:387 start_codon:yes stop_codon:yes gene_type:complete
MYFNRRSGERTKARSKKIGEVVHGYATNDMYMIIKPWFCHGHEVLLQKCKVVEFGSDDCNFEGVVNPKRNFCPRKNEYINRVAAHNMIDHLEYLESRTKQHIKGLLESGLLTEAEYQERLIEYGLTGS